MRLLRNHRINRKTILLVDDNSVMCHLMTKILERDYNVHSFTSPIEAINWLKMSDEAPDVIVTDITMDEMSGVEFAQFLSLNGLYSNIPLIFISGLPESEMSEQIFSVNYNGYAQKPFKPNDLIDHIENVANAAFA